MELCLSGQWGVPEGCGNLTWPLHVGLLLSSEVPCMIFQAALSMNQDLWVGMSVLLPFYKMESVLTMIYQGLEVLKNSNMEVPEIDLRLKRILAHSQV